MPEEAKAVCNGADRAATAGIPNLKGCRLPAGLSGAMRSAASTDGDVRRRKLNRPKDGCRKPPVRRNQDRVLRAAGDLLPRRGGLSRMHGDGHVRFLGGWGTATFPSYPTRASSGSRRCCTTTTRNTTGTWTRGVPRDGAALLQGIVWCGQCGHKMAVQYRGSNRYLQLPASLPGRSDLPAPSRRSDRRAGGGGVLRGGDAG